MIAGGTASSAERTRESPARSLDGMVRFIRYGFMPNRARYCGGDENRLLFDHAVEQVVDGGLKALPEVYRRAALPPAHRPRQRHRGPVRSEVVDAYWIGNACSTGWRCVSSTMHCWSALASSRDARATSCSARRRAEPVRTTVFTS